MAEIFLGNIKGPKGDAGSMYNLYGLWTQGIIDSDIPNLAAQTELWFRTIGARELEFYLALNKYGNSNVVFPGYTDLFRVTNLPEDRFASTQFYIPYALSKSSNAAGLFILNADYNNWMNDSPNSVTLNHPIYFYGKLQDFTKN